MLGLRVILFSALLLVCQVLAAKNIQYNASYKSVMGSNHDATIAWTQLRLTIPVDKEQDVIDNLHTWSEGKYTAKRARSGGHVSASTVHASNSKSLASQELQRMEELVRKKIKEATGGDAEPTKT